MKCFRACVEEVYSSSEQADIEGRAVLGQGQEEANVYRLKAGGLKAMDHSASCRCHIVAATGAGIGEKQKRRGACQ